MVFLPGLSGCLFVSFLKFLLQILQKGIAEQLIKVPVILFFQTLL